MIRIGFVYFSNDKYFDDSQADKYVSEVFKTISSVNNSQIEIVFGATADGMGKIVYKYAKLYNLPIVGFMPKCGYECEVCDCDKLYVIGDNFGDESQAFIDYINILIKIGGGKQALKESRMARKQDKIVFEIDL